MKSAFSTAILVFGLLLPGLSVGQVDRETIRNAEIRQQQLRMQVAEVAQQLEALIGEFDRNGLGDGDEVRTLRALQGAVGSLSESEMQRVVGLLQQSRGAADATQSRRHVADAYTSQKAIMAQLNQLMIEYRRQEAMYDLSVRFSELADRQNANLKETVAIAREAGGKPLADLKESVRLSLQIQAIEQESLHDEAILVLDELARIIDSAAGAQRDRMTAAMRQSEQGRLRPSLRQAADDLDSGSLFRAASHQQTARDQLRELARALARPKDRTSQIRDAVQELAQLTDEQQRVTNDANRLSQRWNPSDAIDAELSQADVVDRSEQIRRDLAEVAPELAQAIRAAQDPMQEARAAFNSNQGSEAARNAQEAARQLEQAAELAREELARVQQSETLPTEAQAAVEQLLERVRQIRQRQETLQTQTAGGGDPDARQLQAATQSVLQRETRDVEAQADTRAPGATEPLRRAAAQMHEAGTALLAESFTPNQATEPQTAAITALKEAESILSQTLENIEEKKQELANLEEAREDVGKLMVEQQKLNTDTAREAAKDEPAATEELARQQEALADQAAEAARELEATAKPAADALTQAGEKMDQAGDQLAENQPADAQPQQQQAMDNLQQAHHALDQQIAQLQNELGIQPNQQQNLENIANQLTQAQQDLTEARQQLPNAGDLLEQQQQIATALREMQLQGQTPPAESPLAQAQQAADRAAEQIAQNQLTAAVQSMGDAQRAMEQAAQQAANQDQPADQPAGQEEQAANQDQAANQPAGQDEQAAQQGEQPAQPQPQAQPAGPSPEQLEQLAQRQAELQQQAQAMAAQQAAAQAAAEQAAQQLAQVGQDVTEIAAKDQGALPEAAEQALAEAAQSLAQAAAQASADQPAQADASAQAAQQALAQAQAAVAMAQSGLTPGTPMAGPPMPGQPMPGPPMPGMEMSVEGDGQRQTDDGQPFNEMAAQGAQSGHAFIGLPERDRQAIQQSQAEPYPEEYAAQIEQYLRNLAAEERK